ncbi:transmembrane protein 272 [Lates calcarifer]|uniref:Si:dkey-19b23.12 n=1 Tax=Lates calcarifer TaxID=8187 RepID=A0A4W6ECA2_LATCA|nr:transmembrane protein 272 [Lates calcarifer]
MSNTGLIRHIRSPPQPPGPILGCSKLFLCIMPIAQIAIGSVYLHDCPRQRYVPIYLIVVGTFGLVLALLSCLPCAQEPKDGTSNPLSQVCTVWNSLTSFFLFCWFIAGNVWIYSIYEPNYNKNTTTVDSYCNRTVYLFAFWTTTLVYILLGLFLVGGCCVLFCFFLCGRADPGRQRLGTSSDKSEADRFSLPLLTSRLLLKLLAVLWTQA